MMTFKIRAQKPQGPHQVIDVFAGVDADHLANCGRLTFLVEEAEAFLHALWEGEDIMDEIEIERIY
jgi:hypothetical protein